ncbi:uncharacterized protein B0H18DRAFT_376825 [Fomitopsis serialis]|uniref:uncharacterized protein n=1 Tax=Fomitopsis serialis TaxID=139415 RepID=UPI0020084713|nr:uncharacterized protein B0H18DRAFT_376825 [Neoantrodia serialis]KAH9925563.1 hypothetical protein B0H18DRAFT_376825 [Neoantrodia serialis]
MAEHLSPVFSLPPELLSECFHFCALAGTSNPESSSSNYAWIAISHVCHHWRTVALSTVRLWSRVILSSQREWMSELLRRSGQTPLDIFAAFPSTYASAQHRADWMASFQVVLGEIARIHALVFKSLLRLDYQVLEMLNSPAPLLQDLSLYQVDFGALDAPEDGPLHTDLVSPFRDTPRLQSLTLVQCHIPSFGLDVNSLKSLTIIGFPWGGVSRALSMQALITTLRSTPLLGSLVMKNATLPTSSTSIVPLPSPAVTLPQLTTALLYGCSTDIVRLLDHLRLPALKTLYLALEAPLVEPPERLASSIARTIQSFGQLSSLCIDGEVYEEFSLRGSVKPLTGARQSSVATHFFKLRVSSNRCRRVLTAFIEHMVFNSVRNLAITSVCRKRVWMTILRQCRNVFELSVRGKRATHILQQMLQDPTMDADGESSEQSASLPFPRLRSLSLDGLRERDFSTDVPIANPFVQFWMERLNERRGRDDDSLVVVQQIATHATIPNALRSLHIALVPKDACESA